MATATVSTSEKQQIKPFKGFEVGDADTLRLQCNKEYAASIGLDLDGKTDSEIEAGVTFIGNDGHEWKIQGPFYSRTISRTRTEAEKVAWIDKNNSRFSYSHIAADRVDACTRITNEIMRIAFYMTPEKVPPRSERRTLKKRLDGLAELQWRLLKSKVLDMAEVRSDAAKFGVTLAQRDYSAS